MLRINNTKKLMDILNKENVKAELLTFKESVKDSKSSSEASSLNLKKIAKTITFKDKKRKVYAAIIRSTEKVSKNKLKQVFNTTKLELIQFESVENYVGFPAGGVPPFGYDAQFVIDEDLKDEEIVLVGGGTIYTLIKIKVEDLKKINDAKIADIKQ